MADGGSQRLFHRGNVLNLRYLLLVTTLLGTLPVLANNRPVERDGFDANLLRVAEGFYLGELVPDVAIVTQHGEQQLSALIAGQPTILLLAYFTCGHTCPMTIQNLSRALRNVSTSGYSVVVLSFDANDNLETLRHVKSTLGDVPPNWTFGLLSPDASRRLTESVGFKFFFSERDQIFVHPTVTVFLSPEGKVMRYLYGIEPRAEDIELALTESKDRAPRLNEVVDMLKLTCFHYDASRSRYVLHPAVVFGAAGLGLLGTTGLLSFAYKTKSKGA